MFSQEIAQKIKDFALTEARMDKVGIASIDRFNESPEGLHPTARRRGQRHVPDL